MIGIIVWLLLILVIAFCAVPGFTVALLTISGIVAVAILVLWLLAKLTSKSAEQRAAIDREKAIREWERVMGRPHPTRKH